MSASAWRVPLSDLLVDETLLRVVEETLASGWWSMGPRVAEFESAFANMVGARHAFAVSSGTAALHLALLAVDCGPGDEVVLPSLNFVAAANSVLRTGATPAFCDIAGIEDLNLDPADVAAAVGLRTKAIIVLHYAGFPCDLDAISAIADAHGLVVIEDAAHAPGSRWRERMCGSIGAVGCFSFFSNKNLPIGEGGMVVTSDEEIAERIRLLRSHGMTTLTWDRHRGHAGSYDVLEAGFNYRLDEIRASLGLAQLERLLEGNRLRAAAADRYVELLDGRAGIVVPFRDHPARSTSSHHLAVVALPEGVDREQLRLAMRDEGIQTSVHYPPIHRFSAYRSLGSRPLPTTESLAGRLLTLPLFPHISAAQVELVASTLLRVLRGT